MAKYKKRYDDRYQIAVAIGYNSDGKIKRKLVYGKTQKEVQEKANELRMQHSMGIKIDTDITVSDWADTWLRTYKSGVGYNTIHMYSFIVENYIKANLGHIKLKDLKTAHLQKIVNENSTKTRTMKQFKLTINQILEQALINDIIIKNPAKGISLPIANKENEKEH